jgi:hypothetical protein
MFGAVTVKADLATPFAGTLTLVGVTDAVSVLPGKNSDNATVPENPLMLMTLTVEVDDPACTMNKDVGFRVRRNDAGSLIPGLFAYELTIVPPAIVPTAAVRTIRSDLR